MASISLSDSPDYGSLQAWEDAAPATLTAIWLGEIQRADDNFTSATTLLTVAGSTSTSSFYKELTTASGASFRDHANAATNALTYNASNGCSISCSGGFQPAILFTSEDYFRMSNIQVENTSSSGSVAQGTGSDGALFDNVIFKSIRGNCLEIGTSAKARNCLMIQHRSAATSTVKLFGSARLINCTLATASDVTATTNIIDESFATGNMKNCAFFGGTNVSDASGCSYTTCYSDDSTPPTGVTNTAYATGSGAQFEGITLASPDYRIKTGSSLRNNGTDDATEAPNDILGTVRSSNDVGCYEFVAAGGGANPRGRALIGPFGGSLRGAL